MRTALFEAHVRLGARIVDFHGWEMPLQYRSIVEEHTAVRKRAGIFDLSHMGRLRVAGPGHTDWLDALVTPNVNALKPGRVKYGFVLNENGGVIDDILVYRFEAETWLVVNASNRERVLAELRRELRPPVTLEDMSQAFPMIAVQGPLAIEFAREAAGLDASSLGYYRAMAVGNAILSRTGYTGEDGLEVFAPPPRILDWWDRLVSAGGERGIIPCGLGSRDTLRLEAGMPLYGQELTDSITPLEAGLEFAVAMEKRFRGREALLQQKKNGIPKTRIGFRLESKRIARHGFPIFSNDRPVGEVTSGTHSPTLGASIGMGYVRTDGNGWAEGTPLLVDIRGKKEAAFVVPLPFYRRPK